jgi:uncharacterized membrane protein YjgN (DUF898 family)
MTEQEIQILIDRAAKEGAKQALRDIGLSDSDAYDDVKELRSLLETWRDTKRTVGQTIARMVTTALLTALAAGVWMNWGGGK